MKILNKNLEDFDKHSTPVKGLNASPKHVLASDLKTSDNSPKCHNSNVIRINVSMLNNENLSPSDVDQIDNCKGFDKKEDLLNIQSPHEIIIKRFNDIMNELHYSKQMI